ncbi:MAG: hypothetical protein ACE5GM_06770 [bacterium]
MYLERSDDKTVEGTGKDKRAESNKALILLLFSLFLLFATVSEVSSFSYKDPELKGKLNPHWQKNACQECHVSKPISGNPAPIKYGGDDVKLCNSCHKTKLQGVDQHVYNVPVVEDSRHKAPPPDFPLKDGNIITCITCHDVRLQEKPNKSIKSQNKSFLRRAPYEVIKTFFWGNDPDERYFQTRYALCLFCHIKGSLTQFSPHQNQINPDGSVNRAMCLFCHTEVPDRNAILPKDWKLRKTLYSHCKSCHMGKTVLHPIRVNHYGRMPPENIAKQIAYSEKRLGLMIPRSNGRLVCPSCHNPHAKGVELNPITRKGADATKRLRVDGYGICLTCHGEAGPGTPKSGRPF